MAYFWSEQRNTTKRRKNRKERKPATTECGLCERAYPADIWIGQGEGIASSLYGSGVVSYFGSEFDGDVHIFEQPIEESAEQICSGASCPICDGCIQDLIDRKLLFLVHETFA